MGFFDQNKAYYTEQAEIFSKNARKIAYGGAAICWFFKSEAVTFPTWIQYAIFSLVLYFLSDLLQYYLTTLNFYLLFQEQKKDVISFDELERKAKNAHKPSVIFLHIKFVFLGLCFLFISVELFVRAL